MNRLATQHFEIASGPRIIFGVDAIDELANHVYALAGKRVFLVTDSGVVRAGVIDRVRGVLDGGGIECLVFDGVESNPSTLTIAEGSAELRATGAAVVVSVGGGSVIDAAKGIALHAVNGGALTDLDYHTVLQHPAPPIIAVPTTAGTGAENNALGIITNRETQRRFYVGNASTLARLAILDPGLTVGLAPTPTAVTGMDVLSHALESLASVRMNPYAESVALRVVQMVASWLPRAVANGADLEARAQMLLAANIVSTAMSTTGLGLCHALAHALGGRLNVPHGLAMAILLPHVLRFNQQVRAEQYARAAFALGVGNLTRSDEDNSLALIDAVQQFIETVGMVRSLSSLGVSPALLPLLVADALADEVIVNTPRMPSADEACAILAAAS